MRLNRLSLTAPLALAATLAASAPALAGGVVSIDGDTLSYHGDSIEPNNVTIALVAGGETIRLDELGSRIVGAPETCTVSADRYRADCPARGVERLDVRTGDAGSDVRIKADLPATIVGGKGDDLLIGGPADDRISGGSGQDVIGGGGGDDVLDGGADNDLLTYVDVIARDGTLKPRTSAVKVRPSVKGGSGGAGEGDTLRNFEQFEGGDGNDRFELRDGRAQSIACNGGRDTTILDPRDDAAIDCENGEVGPAGGTRMTTPTLVFPFPGRDDSDRSSVKVKPVLSLQRGAIVVTIRCQVAIGLLAADGPGCAGTVRMTRAGGYEMGKRSINVARGKQQSWRVPLTASRSLARRAGGLAVTVTAVPSRGAGVRRDLHFTVKG